ncbi:MAG: hypothetical protein ACJ8GW_09355 [Massilia sp.]
MKRALAWTAALWLAAGMARADGLADLKTALARASASAPLRAQLDSRAWRKVGEGKDAEEESGQVGLQVEQGARGLSVTYSRATLARTAEELRARSKNPNSKAPTLMVMGQFDVHELLAVTAAAGLLARTIERDTYKGERGDVWQGSPARVLTFEAPMSSLSERERKYAKQYQSTMELWIGADGTPLASHTGVRITGRAFVVVSFEARHEEDCVYATVADHLLMVRRETRDSSAGAGEREERKLLTTLQVLPGPG